MSLSKNGLIPDIMTQNVNSLYSKVQKQEIILPKSLRSIAYHGYHAGALRFRNQYREPLLHTGGSGCNERRYEKTLYVLRLRVENAVIFLQRMLPMYVMHIFENITY